MELDAGATVHLEVAEDVADRLGQRLLADLFAVGLHVPEPAGPPDGHAFPRLTLEGDARFLVGAYDLGPERGLEVVARGAHHVIDVGLREYRDRGPEPKDAAPTKRRPTGLSGEESGMPVDDAEIVVDVNDAASSLPELLGYVTRGSRVVLTESGDRVAALVSWHWYALQRERLARSAAAYWTAWRGGDFDNLSYAVEVMGVLAPTDGPTPMPANGADSEGRDDGTD
ncbi:hypothetical protein ACWFNE_03090 [Cellulomonas sp. NPDC055163]